MSSLGEKSVKQCKLSSSTHVGTDATGNPVLNDRLFRLQAAATSYIGNTAREATLPDRVTGIRQLPADAFLSTCVGSIPITGNFFGARRCLAWWQREWTTLVFLLARSSFLGSGPSLLG